MKDNKKAKSGGKSADVNVRNDELLRDDTLEVALREAGLDLDGSPVERAQRLEGHYLALPEPVGWKKNSKRTWHLQCQIDDDGCGYMSTSKQDFCPFCGDGKDDATAANAMVLAPKDDAIDAEFIDDGEGLTTPDGEPSGTVEDLDHAVSEINASCRALEAGERALTGCEWDVGQKLFHVFKRSLYYARKKDGGGSMYTSWAQFCRTELKLGLATANRYMRIATNFSREVACELGPGKLVELLPAAEAQAQEEQKAARLGKEPQQFLAPLLDRARVLPVAELRPEVKAAIPQTVKEGKGKGNTVNATQAAAAKKLASKNPEPERITVQRQEGSAKIRWFLSEQAARDNDLKKQAKKFADGIVAIEPAVNGVEVIHTLKVDGKLGLVLHRKIVRLD